MRKQTKFVAVLSAAALLAMGASMTSFAAGWEKDEAGTWHYYDSSDDMVTNEWKKDGGKWFYLDDDGAMVTNQWVENDYYVGEDGAMVVNGWVKALPDDEDVDSPEDTGEHWYYFGSKGKKVTNVKKNIGGKTYFFNDDGAMLSGWQKWDKDNNIYYLGGEDEGWATKSQWRWLEKAGLDDDEDEINGTSYLTCTEEDDCDDEGWYYFDASGKLNLNAEKTINGKKFTFNEHGQMLYEWINGNKVTGGSYSQLDSNLAEASKGKISIADMRWYQENGDGASNGARIDGWQYISGSAGTDTEGDTNWYFFKKGKAKYAETATVDVTKDTTYNVVAATNKDWNGLMDGTSPVYRMKEKLSWSGKSGTFCFDQKGKMKTGLQLIDGKMFFFNDDGFMQTGKVSNVEEADGDTFSYYFTTKNSGKGEGYTGEKDGYLYFNGKRVEADDDYRVVFVKGHYYVVNNKGKCQKTFNKKDLEVATTEGTLETKEDLSIVVVDGDKKVSGINNKSYYIKDNAIILDKDGQATGLTLRAIATVPHIQLEDTDNYVLDNKNVLNPTETAAAEKFDVLTQDIVNGIRAGVYADAQ